MMSPRSRVFPRSPEIDGTPLQLRFKLLKDRPVVTRLYGSFFRSKGVRIRIQATSARISERETPEQVCGAIGSVGIGRPSLRRSEVGTAGLDQAQNLVSGRRRNGRSAFRPRGSTTMFPRRCARSALVLPRCAGAHGAAHTSDHCPIVLWRQIISTYRSATAVAHLTYTSRAA